MTLKQPKKCCSDNYFYNEHINLFRNCQRKKSYNK